MESDWKEKGCSFLVGLVIVIIIGCVSGYRADKQEKEYGKVQYEKGYLDACRDVHMGKLKYSLVENPDGTKEWKKNPEK